MPYMRSVQFVCPKCKKTLTRMQGDVITPRDLNPHCSVCSIKQVRHLGRELKKIFKPKSR